MNPAAESTQRYGKEFKMVIAKKSKALTMQAIRIEKGWAQFKRIMTDFKKPAENPSCVSNRDRRGAHTRT
jgi:hypothetical protein